MPKMRPRKSPLVVLGLIKGGTAKPALVDEHKPLSRLPVNQACVLSVNRCRAACRETPRATAIWFHDLSCARGDLDGLTKPCLVCAHRLGDGCDRSEVICVVDLGGCWVKIVGQLIEPARGPLDLVVFVSHPDHLLIRGTCRTSNVTPQRG
jgi:hypothetical protein